MPDDQWMLKPHPTISVVTRDAPLLVVVLDGWGEAPDAPDNAIALVTTLPLPPPPTTTKYPPPSSRL